MEKIVKIKKINLNQKFKKVYEYWQPKVIAEMNEYQFKLAKVKDEFIWHKHEETDETFFIIKGQLTIELKNVKWWSYLMELKIVPLLIKNAK